MRALLTTCALALLLAGPCLAQATPARFLKVDITSKNGVGCCKAEQGATEVHMRVPLSLARGILGMAAQGDARVDAKGRPKVDVEQLLQLVATAKPGDVLVEITTNTGDLVKIVIE